MAEIVSEYDFPTPGHRIRYPWAEWCDGQVRRIRRHDDYDSTTDNMAHYLWTEARSRGMRARVHKESPTAIVFQILSRECPTPELPSNEETAP